MNISLLDSDAIRTYTDHITYRFQQIRKREKRRLLNLFLIGIVLISIDLITFSDHTFSSNRNGVTKYYDLHLTFGMGLAFLVFIIPTAINRRFYKKKFEDDLQKSVKLYFNRHNYKKIVITDQTVSWETDLVKSEIDWAVVTSYMLLEDALFIIWESHMDAVLVIPRRILAEPDYNELISFLERNKPETVDYHKPI